MQVNQSFPTYVFGKVDRDQVGSFTDNMPYVVQELGKINDVEFSARVTGQYDIVIRLNNNNPAQVYNSINRISEIQGLTVTDVFMANDGFNTNQKFDPQNVWGFTLLSANKPVEEIVQKLKKMPTVHDVSYGIVPGQFDIIVTHKAKTYEDLMRTAFDQIVPTDGIWRSETLFAYQPRVKA